jgi:hypothetical protein
MKKVLIRIGAFVGGLLIVLVVGYFSMPPSA